MCRLLFKKKGDVNEEDFPLINFYAEELEKEYALILDWIKQHLPEGNIIDLKKKVQSFVNGRFSRIINNFLWDHEKNN